MSDPNQQQIDHDPMRDPVLDPVLDPITDPALDPESDPAAMPSGDPHGADPVVVAAVVDIRNRFGMGGLADMVRLAQDEIVAAEQAMQALGSEIRQP